MKRHLILERLPIINKYYHKNGSSAPAENHDISSIALIPVGELMLSVLCTVESTVCGTEG